LEGWYVQTVANLRRGRHVRRSVVWRNILRIMFNVSQHRLIARHRLIVQRQLIAERRLIAHEMTIAVFAVFIHRAPPGPVVLGGQ
jgi:hypothetical protein